MPRKTVGALVMAGITLSGALGGQVMRAGARVPRPRASAPSPAEPRPVQPRPAPTASAVARPVASSHADVSRDVFALAGD